jgi:hypothetical protein
MRNRAATVAIVLLLSACGGSSPPDAPVAAAPGASAAATAPTSVTKPLAADFEAEAGEFGHAAFDATGGPAALPNLVPTVNDSGFAATFSKAGVIDRSGPFFQSLGANGRSCSSCHIQGEGWTITPAGVRRRFEETQGTDPIFRTFDGSNSPLADVSTVAARRRAYSMLLSKGLIRVGIGIPPGAEFELAAVDDPYGYASAQQLSLFRRPLPSANLEFLSTVMWDGRETISDPASHDCLFGTTNCFAALHFVLANQANDATTGHAEAPSPLSDAQRAAIVDFETQLFTAQIFDRQAGRLTAQGARGGPVELTRQTFYFGINDTLAGDYRTGLPFSPTVMTLYDAWMEPQPDATVPLPRQRNQVAEARRAVGRGETLFNSKPIQIRGVKGLNDALGLETIPGTCTTCHDSPNAGDHSVPLPLDIGIADPTRRTPDLPLYTLRNKTTGETVQTTDPGRALISGKWRDIGRFKGPVLRGLAQRAPYFHNGMAQNLDEVVEFYDTRFAMGLSAQEKADLVAFLRTL